LRGVSKDGRECLRPILRGSPLRGEHLRMTGEFFVAPNKKAGVAAGFRRLF